MRTIASVVLLSSFLTGISAQQAPTATPLATVPRLVRIANTFHPANGLAASPVEGITLSIYREEQGGAPLWHETQNVNVDSEGRYSVLMGATLNDGMPLELFAAGEPRWLGVQFQRTGEVEQPRVLLTSVPYALKAADADTLGGLPASSYMLLPTATAPGAPSATAPGAASAVAGIKSPKPLATSGSVNYIGVFTNATDLGNSVMYQLNGNIGISTTAPLISLDARTGSLPQMGIAGTTDYLTFFASDAYGPAIYWDPAKDMRFGKGGAGLYNPYGFVEQMRIQSSTGNVGIGTQAPAAKLEVNGNAQIDGNLAMSGSLLGGGTAGPILQAPAASSNLSVGVGAMPATSGGQNTAAGDNALHASTTGSFNAAFGYGALLINTTGGLNTAVGNAALYNNIGGANNTAVGGDALIYNNGSNNTAVGELALYSNSSGANNTAVGQGALYSNITSGNTAVGQNAMNANTTGAQNTAAGTLALAANSTASFNAAFGYAALQANSTGALNTAIGNAALLNNTNGFNNTAVGADALLSNNGANNTAVGELALYDNTSGIDNTAVGAGALSSNSTASNNVAVGQAALNKNVTGALNTAVGAGALTNSSGANNTGLGSGAASLLAIGNANTAVGSFALGNAAITSQNTAIGYSALNGAFGGNNIALGYLAGSNITSANNTISIGSAGVNDNGAVSIGDNATSINLGGGGSTESFTAYGAVYFPDMGNFGPVGSSLPVYVTSTTGQLFYQSSSRRYKDDIRDMGEASSGLLRLRPVTFHYKKGSPVGPELLQYGLVAEEVAGIFPEIVVRNGSGQVETLDYTKLTPMLVNEVQKLNGQVTAQQDRLRTQERQISSLEERLAEVEAALDRVAPSAAGRRQ